MPAFGYSPETKAYVGAVTLFTLDLYRDSITRTSNAKFEFNYTWRKQIILESEWNYFFKAEKWFTKGRIHYSKFPDKYWGIGNKSADSNELSYDSRRFIFDVSVLKGLPGNMFTGINVRQINYTDVTTSDSAILFPELANGQTSGVGYSFIKDSRNSLLTPIKGMYLNLSGSYNFSTTNYLKTFVDLRYYKTWKEKYTVATRLVNESNFGTTPFYDMAMLGGDRFVRGYYLGRYRDNILTTLQIEARSILIWRFGLAVFGGISDISYRYADLALNKMKPNYGLGLRFVIDRKENINLRIDYAMGAGNSNGFYIAFGESF